MILSVLTVVISDEVRQQDPDPGPRASSADLFGGGVWRSGGDDQGRRAPGHHGKVILGKRYLLI